MKSIQEKLKEFESRPARYDKVGELKRTRMLERFTTINRFEGIEAGPIERRLFKLLSTGKVSKTEYIELCQNLAHAN